MSSALDRSNAAPDLEG